MELIREHSYDNPATSPPDVAGKLVTQEQLDTKHGDYHLMAVLLGELGYEDVAAPGMVECHADFWTFAHFCVSSPPLLRESILISSRGSSESRTLRSAKSSESAGLGTTKCCCSVQMAAAKECSPTSHHVSRTMQPRKSSSSLPQIHHHD
jgi:hypothetical protein